MGLEPTMLYNGLKVRAVRRYGNRSSSTHCRIRTDTVYGLSVLPLPSWAKWAKLVRTGGLEPPSDCF